MRGTPPDFERKVHSPRDLPPGEPEQHAVDDHVLAAGDLGVEAGAELDQRRNPSAHPHLSRRGPLQPCMSE